MKKIKTNKKTISLDAPNFGQLIDEIAEEVTIEEGYKSDPIVDGAIKALFGDAYNEDETKWLERVNHAKNGGM